MKTHRRTKRLPLLVQLLVLPTLGLPILARGFEGRISAVAGRAGTAAGLLYTVNANFLRVELTDTNFPNVIDVVDLSSGQITLIQPMNRTFLRFNPNPSLRNDAGLPPGLASAPAVPLPPRPMPDSPSRPPAMPPPPTGIGPTNFPGMPTMPMPPGGLPPGIGPQPRFAEAPIRPAMLPRAGVASLPPMPVMPPGGGLELQAIGEQTNLLGYICARYEIKQREQTMVIWATDQLGPFQNYLPAQPPRFPPPMIEEQWAALLAAKKLFPLGAVLRAENGVERYRFEVRSVTAGKLAAADTAGFQPPEGYVELQPRPF